MVGKFDGCFKKNGSRCFVLHRGGADGFCLAGFFGLWGVVETSLGAENFVTLIKFVVKLVNWEKVPKMKNDYDSSIFEVTDP